MMLRILILLMLLGLALSSSDRPKCRRGMVYTECGRVCHLTCQKKRYKCSEECVPRCQCPSRKRYWSIGFKKCVTKRKCKKEKALCEDGMIWKHCASRCVRTCARPWPPCFKMCASRCVCPPKKPIWSEEKHKCVELSDC